MKRFGFRISFIVKDADDLTNEEFFEVVEDVAETLHSDSALTDVSVGVTASSRAVDFELATVAGSQYDAYMHAVRAICHAIEAVGSEVETFSHPTTLPIPDQGQFGFREHRDGIWLEERSERVSA